MFKFRYMLYLWLVYCEYQKKASTSLVAHPVCFPTSTPVLKAVATPGPTLTTPAPTLITSTAVSMESTSIKCDKSIVGLAEPILLSSLSPVLKLETSLLNSPKTNPSAALLKLNSPKTGPPAAVVLLGPKTDPVFNPQAGVWLCVCSGYRYINSESFYACASSVLRHSGQFVLEHRVCHHHFDVDAAARSAWSLGLASTFACRCNSHRSLLVCNDSITTCPPASCSIGTAHIFTVVVSGLLAVPVIAQRRTSEVCACSVLFRPIW